MDYVVTLEVSVDPTSNIFTVFADNTLDGEIEDQIRLAMNDVDGIDVRYLFVEEG